MRVLSDHKKPINCVVFSPDGTQLAECKHGGIVRIWDLATGKTVQAFGIKWTEFPNKIRVAFSPNGKQIAAAAGPTVLVDLESDKQRRFPGGRGTTDVAFSPTGGQILAAGDSHGRWSVKTAAARKINLPVARGFRVLNWPACAFNRDGSRLAISRRISRVVGEYWRNTDQLFIYDPIADTAVATLEWTGHPAQRVAFSPNGSLVAAVCGPVLRVWDLTTSDSVAEKQAGKLHFLGMAFSPDGRYIATVSKDRTTRLWEVGVWGEPRTFDWDVGKLLDVAFVPDGTTAAVASDTGKIVLFDVD